MLEGEPAAINGDKEVKSPAPKTAVVVIHGMGEQRPQCGPNAVTLRERYFKQKDMVENYLAAQAKADNMDLGEAQAGIARDWTQYLAAARQSIAVASLQINQPAAHEARLVFNKHSHTLRLAANQRVVHKWHRHYATHVFTARNIKHHARRYFYYRCTSRQPDRFGARCVRIFIHAR